MREGERIEEYPARIVEKVRYSDTDRQGHVNNVLFAFFFEAGRVDILHGDVDLSAPGCFFVLARSTIDFLGELNWPGEVEVGTRLAKIGNSSMTIRQALFQNGRCGATSESVMVQVDIASRAASPLTDEARALLERLVAVEEG
jgi:acyl-CoA thioester hydrolase